MRKTVDIRLRSIANTVSKVHINAYLVFILQKISSYKCFLWRSEAFADFSDSKAFSVGVTSEETKTELFCLQAGLCVGKSTLHVILNIPSPWQPWVVAASCYRDDFLQHRKRCQDLRWNFSFQQEKTPKFRSTLKWFK